MEQERIRELLYNFYEGKTSEEEEAQLRSYLSDPDVTFSPDTGSGYLTEVSPEVPEPSEDFYARLEAVTRGEAEVVAMITRRRGIMRYAMSIAAAAAIMTGVYLIFDNTGRKEMQDTYNDPEIAMAEVRSILMAVSEKMTTGTEPLGSINSMNVAPGTLDELGKINSMVGEKLSGLRYLDRVDGSEKNTDNN